MTKKKKEIRRKFYSFTEENLKEAANVLSST